MCSNNLDRYFETVLRSTIKVIFPQFTAFLVDTKIKEVPFAGSVSFRVLTEPKSSEGYLSS